jgi:cell wall-associated NlpC family hydrolase
VSDDFAAAAASLVGAPFRLHGRDPASGLDCVGLVAAALDRCGRRAVAPQGYALRATRVAPLLHFAARNGFVPLTAETPPGPGDLVLLRLSPIQVHLVVLLTGPAFVHAHAGLGQVVIERGTPRWAAEARWRLQPES